MTETLRAMMTEEMEMKDYVNVVNLYVREYELLALLESPDLFLTVGRASILLDLEDLAVETFTKAERLMADKEKPTDLLFNLAKHHFMMNELDEAMARLELIPEPPSDDKYAPDVFELKGRILLEQKEYKQAAEMFSSVLKYNLKPCDEMNILLEKAKALTGLKYYNTGIHKAAFALPQGFTEYLQSI